MKKRDRKRKLTFKRINLEAAAAEVMVFGVVVDLFLVWFLN